MARANQADVKYMEEIKILSETNYQHKDILSFFYVFNF